MIPRLFGGRDVMNMMKLNRRKTLAAMSASACWAMGPGQAEGDDAGPADKAVTRGTLTLGFGTYGLPKHSLENSIDLIAEAGYDSLEICVLPDRDAAAEKMSRTRRREIRDRLSDKGLQLTSLMANLRPWSSLQRHRQDVQRLKRDCELAHQLSPNAAPAVQTVLGEKHWADVKGLSVERMTDWLKVAESSQTVVAIKPHRGHAMSRPSEAAWLLAQLGHPPHLKMWFDYSHYLFRDMPMAKMVKQSLPIMAGVAVKDAVQQDGRVMFALPGQSGTIDYAQLFGLLYQGGYRGDICVEVSSQVWRRPDYDPEHALNFSYQHLNMAMARGRKGGQNAAKSGAFDNQNASRNRDQ
ncbi:MAG: sugar phosphate isomerase/epimerase [Pirellulales bacterium]|nr:sugar phosphate isomerase/epimerase [Pirellulales bacterium]